MKFSTVLFLTIGLQQASAGVSEANLALPFIFVVLK